MSDFMAKCEESFLVVFKAKCEEGFLVTLDEPLGPESVVCVDGFPWKNSLANCVGTYEVLTDRNLFVQVLPDPELRLVSVTVFEKPGMSPRITHHVTIGVNRGNQT